MQGFCDQLDDARRVTLRRERIDDRACLRLIRTGLEAGMLETDGHGGPPETGSPHGGSLAPVRAQGYWPYALEGGPRS